MPHISTALRVAVALHHARAECRLPDHAVAERQKHRTVFCDLIEQAEYPHLVLAEVTRRLGRQRAFQVEIDPATINAAVRTPKIFSGRL